MSLTLEITVQFYLTIAQESNKNCAVVCGIVHRDMMLRVSIKYRLRWQMITIVFSR
jgi:hypothetical protein